MRWVIKCTHLGLSVSGRDESDLRRIAIVKRLEGKRPSFKISFSNELDPPPPNSLANLKQSLHDRDLKSGNQLIS